MIKRILQEYLLKAVLIVLAALILFGVYTGSRMAVILVVFTAWRLVSLVNEALRQPLSPEKREAMVEALARRLENPTTKKRATAAAALKIDSSMPAQEIAEIRVNRIVAGYVPPRPLPELSAEALGAVAFAILIPLSIALESCDFFSLRGGYGWGGACVVVLCLALYAWPHRWLKSSEFSQVRSMWWSLPFVLALPFLEHAIDTRHAYLNPFNPDHNRLAAERVLSLKNNVVAGHHADWVLRYARQLDQQGDSGKAIHFYREALRLSVNNREVSTRLAQLEAKAPDFKQSPGESPAGPYWSAGQPVTKSPRQRIGSQLEAIDGWTVVIVPVGNVPSNILDAVGYAIHHELGLPVLISTDAVPLPPCTRIRGLATGPQWHQTAIYQAFTNSFTPFPRAPIKYLLVTSVDIYFEDVNYIFSSSYPWGALLSCFRFGISPADEPKLLQRTAKQGLCAVLKSFGLPQSPDQHCVTSYSRDLAEFDAKGNRPDAETLAQFRKALAEGNRKWQSHKAAVQANQPGQR